MCLTRGPGVKSIVFWIKSTSNALVWDSSSKGKWVSSHNTLSARKNFGQFEFRTNACPKLKLSEISRVRNFEEA